MSKTENIKEYKNRLDHALENEFLRAAMDNFAVAYRTARQNAFAEINLDRAIKKVAQIKAEAVLNNDRLFKEFKTRAEENGIHVHLAENSEHANRIISDIAEATGSKAVVKSKSMTAEEIHLNRWLESKGIEVTETDLGEWIVQLRKEGPSHMVMPAIHLSRFQVADLFSSVTQKDPNSDIDELVKVARRQLRRKFVEADMGITGANYAIARTGTIGIATNEGNARLVTTLPKVHVALVGIDKLLPSMEDALSINRILPKNATGQAITSYVTWITGPSENKAVPGNKREMHIVFLDNGRKKIASDPVFSQVLQCVRCGACANVCPVYRMVGGHQLGYVYIGAIGLITTYFFHGKENAKNLVQNCTNCGACKEICAGGIDLPKLIKEVHSRIQDDDGHPLKSMMLSKMLKNRKLFHALLKTAKIAQKPLVRKTESGSNSYLRHLPMIFSGTHNYKVLPAIADKSFRDRFRKLYKPVVKPSCRIALFAGCLQDFVYPEQLEPAMELFRKARINVEFPMDQSCCGLPAMMMGEKEAAQNVAIQNMDAFKDLDVDYIVTLCASCASHIKNHVPDIVKDYDGGTADEFISRVMVFSQFIKQVVGLDSIEPNGKQQKAALHLPCHQCRGMGLIEEPREVLERTGRKYVQCEEEQTCCGFGGSFSINFPNVSKEILTRKLDDVEKSGAKLLLTECPGCIMQLRGGALKQGRNIQIKHMSEVLKIRKD